MQNEQMLRLAERALLQLDGLARKAVVGGWRHDVVAITAPALTALRSRTGDQSNG